MSKKTIGQLSYDLMKEKIDPVSAEELQKQSHDDYIKNLRECAEKGAERWKSDFFISVLTQNEKLLYNVFRNKFIDLKACPEPNYDQTVYRFDFAKQNIEYIWTIPDRESCFTLLKYADEVVAEEQWLLSFVMRFANGDLRKLMKHYNNEQENTPLLH